MNRKNPGKENFVILTTPAQKKHFKRVAERPFQENERNHTTILFGGLTRLADKFIESSIRSLGYKALALPVPDMEAMSRGKEFCDTGLCNPTYFTAGNLIIFLEKLRESGLSRDEIIDSYIFVTAGSCGPCRFGMYEYEYQYALENAGFHGFRLIVFQMAGELNQGDLNSGLKMDFEFFRGILNSLILSDHLNELRHLIKPYECTPGTTDRVIEECADLIKIYLENRKPIRNKAQISKDGKIRLEKLKNILDQWTMRDLKKVLKHCNQKINEIKLNYRQVKPVIKITGEFWAQSTEGDGNYNIFEFLEDEGCEIIVEPASSWIMYLIWSEKFHFNEKSMVDETGRITLKTPLKFFRALLLKGFYNLYYNTGIFLYNYQYNKVGRLLGNRHHRLTSVDDLARIAEKYMDIRYEGGEGFLEVAKNIYYTKNHLAHMVLSLKPFGCMPSTISDSVQVRVMADYNKMIFLPLETSGEGKINALSRVQMALGEARDRATKEYESAMEKLYLKKIKADKKNMQPVNAKIKLPRIKGITLKAILYLKSI